MDSALSGLGAMLGSFVAVMLAPVLLFAIVAITKPRPSIKACFHAIAILFAAFATYATWSQGAKNLGTPLAVAATVLVAYHQRAHKPKARAGFQVSSPTPASGITSSVREWASTARTLSALIAGADAVFLSLTGTNPKHFHPKLYRHLLEQVKSQNDEAQFIGSAPINEHEAALIMLATLIAAVRDASDGNPLHNRTAYERAANELRVRNRAKIRPAVSLWAFAHTG